MKIAIIGPAYPYRGGISMFSERLAKALQDAGHEVVVYTFTLQYPSFLFPGKSQYSDGPAPKDLNIIRCINAINPLTWWKTGKKIRKTSPDLVLVKFWLPLMGPAFGTILRSIRKYKPSKIISIVHNIIPHESRFGDRPFTQYFTKAVDGFVALSDIVIKDLDQFKNTQHKTLSPHPLYDNFGSPIPKEEALKKLDLNPDQKVILFFGLIRPYKGLDLLIDAFADKRLEVLNLKLIIAGEYYTDKQPYLDQIEKYNLSDRIVMIDQFVPDSEVTQYFSAADLVVQPYRSATQSGVSQVAYHFNTPMVVTNVGGLAELCPHGKVGYVAEPQPLAITDTILKFFTETDQTAMSENIKEEKKKYSWDILVKNILDLKAKL